MVTIADKNIVNLVGKETTFNTPVSTTKDLGLIQSRSLTENNNILSHYSLGKRDVQQLSAGKYGASFDISAKYQHGRVLEIMFGTPTNTTTTGDTRHVFVDPDDETGDGAKTLTDEALSFTYEGAFEVGGTDVVKKFAGCKIGSISFDSALNDVFKWSASIVGSSVDASSTSASAKVISDIPVLEHFRSNLSSGAESSEVAQTVIQDFNLDINNSIQEIEGLGSRTNQDIADNQLNVTFKFTKVFQNKTEYERFLGGSSQSSNTPTETSLIFNVHNGVALGSGRIEFYAKVVGQYETYDEPVDLNQAIVATFTGTGKLKVLYTVDNISAYF